MTPQLIHSSTLSSIIDYPIVNGGVRTMFSHRPMVKFIRDEIVPLIGGFPCFWGNFHHYCDFPRSVIKFWGDGGGAGPLVKLYSHHYDQMDV